MNDLLLRLRPKERRGSKPRCHLLTNGSPEQIAARLTSLVSPFATVAPTDRWMPQGFDDVEEPQLHHAPRLVDSAIGSKLKEWWLAPASQRAKTPNIDIASTCTIEGRPGLLLVEAKAHDEELTKEAAGRTIRKGDSDDRAASHDKIGTAIEQARRGLSASTSLPWGISRDRCYQMSNRFAWAWKLTELGTPVVLVYLGFLRADEMADRGIPFATEADWETLVRAHGHDLVPEQAWNRRWTCMEQPFIPLIRATTLNIADASDRERAT